MTAARFIVTGKVQGVFFRASTREQIRTLGLRGHAKNLDDGSVEIVAAGNDATLDQLQAWLRHGPPLARVEHVVRSVADVADFGVGSLVD